MTVQQLIELLQQMPPDAEIVKPDINYEGFERLQAATASHLVFQDNGYICETDATPLLADEQILDAVILEFEDH
jgi:hypothetical protein